MTLTWLAVAWLLTYLVHSTLLLGGAWLLTATGIVRTPLARETLWKVALVGGLLTASVYSLFPYQPYAAHVELMAPAARAPVAPPAPAMTLAAAPVGASRAPAARGVARLTSRVAPVASDVSPLASFPSAVAPHASSLPWPTLLLAIWGLGALALLGRVAFCRVRLSRHLARRRDIVSGPLPAMLDALRAQAGVRRAVRLTASPDLAGPVAMGPSEICLPERALTALSPAEQRAVLAHELGHLVRQDPLWLGVAVACESVLFLQPLNRLARRRMQEAAEYLCDDWAAHQTGGGLTLAKCLAEVATWIEAGPRYAPISGMAENRSQLVERVHRLLQGAQPSVRRLRAAVPVAALALASVAFAAPGVSPPCPEDLQDASASAARAPRAAQQGDSGIWATIRDGRLLTFRDGFAPRLTGQGHLGIRRGGRQLELGDGQRLLVNGRAVRDDEMVPVCANATLLIVDEAGRTLWQVQAIRTGPAEGQAMAWSGATADARDDEEAWAEQEAEPGEEADSLEARLDSLAERLDALDTLDVAEITRAAMRVSERVTREVNARVLPRVAIAQREGLRVATEIAPQLAGLSARVVTDIVPAIVAGVCGGGLCDSTDAPVKRHKTLAKHRR